MKKTAKTEGVTLVDAGAGETGTKKRAVARKSISKPTPIIVHDITDDTEDELPVEVQEEEEEEEQEEVKREYCVTEQHTQHKSKKFKHDVIRTLHMTQNEQALCHYTNAEVVYLNVSYTQFRAIVHKQNHYQL